MWANPSTVVQALEVPPSGATRVAGCWYSATSFTVDVNVGAGTYNLELYVLDYDKLERNEQIQLSAAWTGTVLSTQTVAGFSGGAYMNWTISGNVLIKITNEGAINAVLSGLFLDPVSTGNAIIVTPPAGTGYQSGASVNAGSDELGTLDFDTGDSQPSTTTIVSAAPAALTAGGMPPALVVQDSRHKPSGWSTGLGME